MIKIAEIPQLIEDVGRVAQMRRLKRLSIKSRIQYAKIETERHQYSIFEVHRIIREARERIRIEEENYANFKKLIVRKWKDKFKGL